VKQTEEMHDETKPQAQATTKRAKGAEIV